MPDQLSQPSFEVNLFAVVRLTLPNVTANLPQEAVAKAIEHADLETRFVGSNSQFADELSHYLVNLSGDRVNEQSQWFYSRDNPLLSNLARLIIWHDRGQPEHELRQIIRDARDILANSI